MPFQNGTFANVSGASNAAAGQIVQSAVWNDIHEDYSAAFTQLMQQMIAQITNRNILWMNGGFEVWQRGAGASSDISVGAGATAYTADRWYLTTTTGQASTVSAQTGLQSNSQLAARVRRTAAQTGTGVMTFGYPLDTDEVIRMRGNKVTLSFLVQAGANWSPASGTLTAALYVGTGAVAKRGAGFTSETTVLSVATNLTAGGAAVEISGTSSAVVPTSSTQAEIQFTWTPVGTAGSADDITIDNVQIECNLSADTYTPMNFDTLDFPSMLAGCKRFYQKTFPYSTAPAAGAGQANNITLIAAAADRVSFFWQFPTEMRSNASVLKYNPVTATSSNFYLLTSIAGTVTNSLATTLDVTYNTNATKGMFIFTASATAAGAAFFAHLAADAGI